MLDNLKERLKQYNQEHLLKYYNDLSDEDKKNLIEQISSIDLEVLKIIDEEKEEKERGIIEPIDALKIPEINENIEKYHKIGIEALKKGKVGAVLLAGGQGTRLGIDKPKGMLNVGTNKELYLFEILINNIMKVVNDANEWVPLFIMTSDINDKDTKDFFAKNNYFGYNKEYITFFIQEMAPATDYSGKIYMEKKGKISMSPNGNGGWYSSMKKYGITDQLITKGIEWLNVFSVDNVLQKIADPYFVGATIDSGYSVGSKVIRKVDPYEKVGVMCKKDGKPSIVEYYELTEEMAVQKDESGERAYNFGVILNYLFNVNKLEKTLNNKMPIHIVEKKIPYIDDDGKVIKPENPNGYKFETLVLDMIEMMENCLVYEVDRSKEFAPIKNKEGVDSLVTAREMLKKNGVEL